MISAVSPTRSVLLASSIMSLHQDGHIRGTASQLAATAVHGTRGSPCERFHRSDIYNGATNRVQHHRLRLQEKSYMWLVCEPKYLISSLPTHALVGAFVPRKLPYTGKTSNCLALKPTVHRFRATRRLEGNRLSTHRPMPS